MDATRTFGGRMLGAALALAAGACAAGDEDVARLADGAAGQGGGQGAGAGMAASAPGGGQLVGAGGGGAQAEAGTGMDAPPVTGPTEGSAGTLGLPPAPDGFDVPGPFETVEEAAGPDHSIHRPRELGGDGVRHPVVLWGNGTLMPTSSYAGLLAHWASHGFVVVAASTTSSGTGVEMLEGIEWLRGSAIAAEVDLDRVGASGHSQGGSGAIVAGSDARVHATAVIEPGPSYVGGELSSDASGLMGPTFMIAGGADGIVSPAAMVQPRYEAADHVDAVYGIHGSADHFAPTGDASAFRGYTTAFFRAHLMDDPQAHAVFSGDACGICADPQWTVQRNYE